MAAKTYNDAKGALVGGTLAVFVLAILVMGGVIADTWKKAWQKNPHQDAALAEVRKLIALQEDEP